MSTSSITGADIGGAIGPQRVDCPSSEWTLTARRAALLLTIALGLNSLFAIFGSLLWGYFPYWPAFMISALVTGYFGRWGLLLAILSPVASTFLGMGDAQFYLYAGVNLVQMGLVLLAFRWLRIPPALNTLTARLKYILFVIIGPSVAGATMAWLLRRQYPDANDPPLYRYVFWWTAENLLPALVPGIWLHRVLGEVYRPFTWELGKNPRSWARKAIGHCLPWLLSLLCIGVMLLLVVLRMVKFQQSYVAGLTKPGLWQRISADVVSQIPGFPLTILALTISFLFSLGYSIQYAKQSWILTEAVRRHFPNRKISDLLLSGITVPTEERVVAVAIFTIRSFTEASALLSPEQFVLWLNGFFALVATPCSRVGASLDTLAGDSLTVVFDVQAHSRHPGRAIEAVLSVFAELDGLNCSLRDRGLPPLEVAGAVDYGSVVAGEIGVPARRQYSFVGDAIMSCHRLVLQTMDLPDSLCPLLISRRCIKEAGLLSYADRSESFISLSVPAGENESPETAYSLGTGDLVNCGRKIEQLRVESLGGTFRSEA